MLIYGASGAIGTMAIQIAKSLGAEVTGVCSYSNAELVKSLGADKIIDYTDDSSINKLEMYDYILDAVGKNKKSNLKTASKKAIKENGKYISVDDELLKLRSEYFKQLTVLCEEGKIKAVTDSIYPLEQIVEAHRYVDKKHKKGNVVITI
jgi:NADPH:quinone reductase-like Zn-dependent oxidoreductase